MEDVQARELVGRVEGLLGALEALPDPAARAAADETVAGLLELYGEVLSRILAGEAGLARALGEDELVSQVLILHGLHPDPVEQRVRAALEGVRPYLSSHGGDVELLAVEGEVVRLALEGSCSGCPSSAVTLKLAIEDAIRAAAPEIERVEADGVEEPAAPGAGNGRLLQIEGLSPAADGEPAADGGTRWSMAGPIPELRGEAPVLREVEGAEVLFLRLAGSTYAYRPGCPGCNASLGAARLEATALVCVGCGRRFDALRAGRCLDDPGLHLEPLPLLTDDEGLVRVALGAAA